MFYLFDQNNSGGFYVGPEYVFVEADSGDEANRIAEATGIVYFEGISAGKDCACCGDRWHRHWDDSDARSEVPEIYGMKIWEMTEKWYIGRSVHIYFSNGDVFHTKTRSSENRWESRHQLHNNF